jgi:hypothetical protein
MNINFKKLLPRILQDTRWGELIEAVQSVLTTVKTDKIDIIRSRYELDNMTGDDYITAAKELGYVVKNYDGYCDSDEYKLRELYTTIPRMWYKNTYSGYDYLSFIYGLTANVYPLYYDNQQVLRPVLDWATQDENDTSNFTLDREGDNAELCYQGDWGLDGEGSFLLDNGETLDNGIIYVYNTPINDGYAMMYLDDIYGYILDQENIINSITRHILYSYEMKYVESSTAFISDNTARALYYDLMQHKRKTEIPYFEPFLEISTNRSSLYTTENYTTWDSASSGQVRSWVKQNSSSGTLYDISSGDIVRFGSGSYDLTINSGELITDVENYLFQVKLNISSGEISSGTVSSGDLSLGCDIISKSEDELEFRKWIIQKNKTVKTFSEIAIWDITSSCIYYAEFPTINLTDTMYTNVSMKINLI